MKTYVDNLKMTLFIFILIFSGVGLYYANYYNLFPNRVYNDQDFNVHFQESTMDFDNDGVDDYLDFLLGARADAENRPKYDGSYITNGYPPEDVGVCTDVIWRAFKNAGYSLRDMIDKDILANANDYSSISKRDKNIDFRRVINLRVFFDKYAIPLTLDIDAIDQWQAGDIAIFTDNKHIGLVSDKRNKQGHSYIIHNSGQPKREEDFLKRTTVIAHYRFDASLLEKSLLLGWKD